MANHGYATTRKFMSIEKVDADLREFMVRNFGDIAEIEGPFDMDDELAGWIVRFFGDPYEAFSVWLSSRRKLEFRHPIGQKIPSWAQLLFQHEMAKRYDGYVTDDGYEGKTDADPDKLNTYKKWVDLQLSIHSKASRIVLRPFHYMHLDPRYKKTPSFS